MKRLCTIFMVMIIALSGCFYSFNPGGESIIETIAVTQFENNTIEAGLSNTMTDLIIDALIADGNLKVVSEESAEGILFGTLTTYRRDAYTYDEFDNVKEYMVRLNFEVKLVKADSEEEFWSENFYSEGIFDADAETEEEGQERAIERLVADIMAKTTKSW